MQLQPGQNVPVGQTQLQISLGWSPELPGMELDPSAFVLGADGKVGGDEAFIFYGQLSLPSGALRLDIARHRFELALDRLPTGSERVVIALTIDQGLRRGQRFGQLQEVRLDITGDVNPIGFHLSTGGMSETALILGEFYRRAGKWKFRAVGQGFTGGLAPLASQYGVDVADNPDRQAPTPTPLTREEVKPAPVSPPRKETQPAPPARITLEKAKPISLEKRGGAFGEILINLNWSQQEQRGWFGRQQAIDLDLGCMIELKDGFKTVVQALGNTFGAFETPPFAQLMGDDRTGDSAGGENLRVNGAHWDTIRRVLIYAFIYEGVPNWAAADGVVTIRVPGQSEIIVRLDNHSNSHLMCAIAMLENDGGRIRATKLIDYYAGHEPMDRAHGFGFRWMAGSK